MNRIECRKAIIMHLPACGWMRMTELRAHIAYELDETDAVPLSIFSLMRDTARLAALDVPSLWMLRRELRRMQREGLVKCRKTPRYRLDLPMGYVREWQLKPAAFRQRIPDAARLSVVR